MDPPFDVEMKQILCQMGHKLVRREGRNGQQLWDLCHVTWFQPMRSWVMRMVNPNRLYWTDSTEEVNGDVN